MIAPRDGAGDRRGPRFTVGKNELISCDWPVPEKDRPSKGILVWDNHTGFALGSAYALVETERVAERLVIVLNFLHSLGVPL